MVRKLDSVTDAFVFRHESLGRKTGLAMDGHGVVRARGSLTWIRVARQSQQRPFGPFLRVCQVPWARECAGHLLAKLKLSLQAARW
jgi:hypothetical protein